MTEILDSFEHIELSPEEQIEAIIIAKAKKEDQQRIDRLKKIEEENRKRKSQKFDFMMTSSFFLKRAENLFKGKFVVDEKNQVVFDMLCHYFNGDPTFITMAEAYGVKNPMLEKGLMLVGFYGTGKTWMMKLFQQNRRQSFVIKAAKEDIVADYQRSKTGFPLEFTLPIRNALEDPQMFGQRFAGLCIDDLGSESINSKYGNVSNVIGDLLEIRYNFSQMELDAEGKEYELKLVGPMLHATSNLTADQLKEYYGGRVASRMRECFNFIQLKGEDRRK